MGSASDYPVMEKAEKTLAAYGLPFETHVLSAHRSPEALREFAEGAEGAGIGVIIAAAGKAAHLAGAVASYTTLPVIGVPVKSSALDGLDALLSTVQMPSGVPVAVVAIDGAENAAILAAEILALGDQELAGRVRERRARMKEDALRVEKKWREKAHDQN
jgi:5-(carboxyamino)imidazole ribonucleotide mutase